MAQMVLGGYTFNKNPTQVSDLMVPIRHTAAVKTYTSLAFFSWGASMLGKEITLKWEAMTRTQFEVHQAQLENDVAIAFTPQDGSGQSYTVEVRALRGICHMELAGDWRTEVELDLMFLSEGA